MLLHKSKYRRSLSFQVLEFDYLFNLKKNNMFRMLFANRFEL